MTKLVMRDTYVRAAKLIEMLRYMRPAGSLMERKFIEKYIVPSGAKADLYGNYILRIGTAPVLWSSHTDTVHFKQGMQKLAIAGNCIKLPSKTTSNCLGADCTTGVWIMLEMIKYEVEGLYIFHRMEEVGAKGSGYIAKHTPDVLKDIKFAIAFDRRAGFSVITEQTGGVCASQAFVNSIVPMLPPGYRADPCGMFTDTASYMDIIPECSNLSVGYVGEHTSHENQNLDVALALRDAMLVFDPAKLVAARDPSNYDKRIYYSSSYWDKKDRYSSYYEGESDYYPLVRTYDMMMLVKERPAAIASFLEEMGYDVKTLEADLEKMYQHIPRY